MKVFHGTWRLICGSNDWTHNMWLCLVEQIKIILLIRECYHLLLWRVLQQCWTLTGFKLGRSLLWCLKCKHTVIITALVFPFICNHWTVILRVENHLISFIILAHYSIRSATHMLRFTCWHICSIWRSNKVIILLTGRELPQIGLRHDNVFQTSNEEIILTGLKEETEDHQDHAAFGLEFFMDDEDFILGEVSFRFDKPLDNLIERLCLTCIFSHLLVFLYLPTTYYPTIITTHFFL